MIRKKVLVIAALFILAGCSSTRMIDYTIVSSKNVSINTDKRAERVSAKSSSGQFLGIPLGKPDLKEATDRAIEKAGPEFDALIDGVIYKKYRWFILFGVNQYVVEGTPVKTNHVEK